MILDRVSNGDTYSALGEGKRADACVGCGQCTHACPQGIDVPAALAERAAAVVEWGERTGKMILSAVPVPHRPGFRGDVAFFPGHTYQYI